MDIWLAVDQNGDEHFFIKKPVRRQHPLLPNGDDYWISGENNGYQLAIGMIKALLGYNITWQDEPVEWDGAPEKCVWKHGDDGYENFWNTSCQDSYLESINYGFKYCPSCGREIVTIRKEKE